MRKRETNIELLRILSTIGVIMLHYIVNGGKLLATAMPYTLNWYMLVFLNSMFVCAVDCFVFISGYFMCTSSKAHTRKVVQLLLEVILYQVCLGIWEIFHHGIAVRRILIYLIPQNWFVVVYVALYCIFPFLNKLIQNLDRRQLRLLVVVSLALFSVQPTMIDVLEGLLNETWKGASTIGILGSGGGLYHSFFCMYLFPGSLYQTV